MYSLNLPEKCSYIYSLPFAISNETSVTMVTGVLQVLFLAPEPKGCSESLTKTEKRTFVPNRKDDLAGTEGARHTEMCLSATQRRDSNP